MQQPMQYQQRLAPQMMPPRLPVLTQQQQQQQRTSTAVSAALGSTAQALNQSPTTFDSSLSNISGLSNMSGLSGLMNLSPGMEMGNQDVDMNTPPTTNK